MLIFSLFDNTFQLLTKHGEENCKVDWTRSLFEHLINLFLFHVQASCDTKVALTYNIQQGLQFHFSSKETL